jgi:hypothetical protein
MKRVLLSFISFFMLFAIAATAQTQDLGYNTALAGRVCDSAMVQQWNGTAWQLAGYQVYRFTNSGLVSEYRTYGTNGLTEQMLYNRNSSNMTTTISDLSNVNGTMQSAYQILLGYNTAGKITSETVLSPDSATMGYDSSYRILNAYDASNYLTSQTLQAYYGGMWMNFENLAYTNNSAGFPTSVLQQSWDMMNNAWTTSARETYTLNSDNTVASILQETNTATSGSPIWANQQRTTYGTYAYGRPSYTLTENWDDANSAWIGSTLDSVTNAREISYNYTNGGWEPNQLITCSGNAPLTQPSAPVSLTAAPNGNGSITLNWSMGSNMGTGYNVYRSTDTANASSWTKIGTAASTATSYVDSNLSKNVTYYYRITAYNSLYESGYSNVASAVILTGISAARMPLLSLYPNPANSALILENNGAAGQYVLSITDLMGREIIHQNLKDPSARINVNVEALAAGMYNVILKSDSEVRSARVMISR